MRKRKITTRVNEALSNWIEHQAELKEKSLSATIAHFCEISRSADVLGKKCVPPIHVFRQPDVCTCGEKVCNVSN